MITMGSLEKPGKEMGVCIFNSLFHYTTLLLYLKKKKKRIINKSINHTSSSKSYEFLKGRKWLFSSLPPSSVK